MIVLRLLICALAVLIVGSILDKGGVLSCFFKLVFMVSFGILAFHLWQSTNIIALMMFVVGLIALINFATDFIRHI
jgi:hypothetical protein